MRRKHFVVALALWMMTLSAERLHAAIPWMSNIREAQQIAREQQRLLLLHFYADWCGPCLRLEREVFPRPDVSQVISSSFVPVKIDVERQPDVARQFDIRSFPTDVILDPTGRVLSRSVTPGDAAKYIQLLNDVAASQRVMPPQYALASQGERSAHRYADRWSGPSQPGAGAYEPSAPPANSEYGYRAPYSGGDGRSDAAYGYNGSSVQGPAPNQAEYAPPYANRYAPGAGPGPAAPLTGSAAGDGNQSGAYANQWDPRYDAAGPQYQAPSRGPARGMGEGQVVDNRYAAPGPGAAMQPQTGYVEGQATADADLGADRRGLSNPAEPLASRATSEMPLALDGYCPVALVQNESWERGDPRWGAIHRGRTYLFVAESHQRQFLADPDRYSPVLSGYDPTRYIDYGEVALGKRKHGLWFRGKMYLFADEVALERFQRSPEYYAQKSHEIMIRGAGR